MTETQAAELIATMGRIEAQSEVCAAFAQIAGFGACAAAGLMLTLVFMFALQFKRVIT